MPCKNLPRQRKLAMKQQRPRCCGHCLWIEWIVRVPWHSLSILYLVLNNIAPAWNTKGLYFPQYFGGSGAEEGTSAATEATESSWKPFSFHDTSLEVWDEGGGCNKNTLCLTSNPCRTVAESLSNGFCSKLESSGSTTSSDTKAQEKGSIKFINHVQ